MDRKVVMQLEPVTDETMALGQRLLREMLAVRRWSERLTSLHAQGRIAVYPPLDGHEAAVIGVAAALDPEVDWIAPQYREGPGLCLFDPGALERTILWLMGNPSFGSGWHHVLPVQSAVAAHLPHAVGLAWGLEFKQQSGIVVAFFGDGATSQGDFHEALNIASVRRLPVLFVCVNNGWALSTPFVAQSGSATIAEKALSFGIEGRRCDGRDIMQVVHETGRCRRQMTENHQPILLEIDVGRLGSHTSVDDDTRYRSDDDRRAAVRRDPITALRTALVGTDGWDDSMERAAIEQADSRFDCAWAAASAAPTTDPRVSVFAPVRSASASEWPTPVPPTSVERMTMVEAIRTTLADLMESDDRILVLGEDVARAGGVFGATHGLHHRFGSDRVVDLPLAEGGIVGTAIGLAQAGLTPVVELQFLGFALQAMHQIVGQLARVRWRSGGASGCAVTIRAPFGGGVGAPELHSDSMEALFCHVPGLKVAVVSTPSDAAGLLAAAVSDPDPVLILEPMARYRTLHEEVSRPARPIALGQAKVARPGEDVVVFTWGGCLEVVLDAANIAFERSGTRTEVVDLRTLVPLDKAAIQESVERIGRVVVVHEAPRTGGFAGEIIAVIQETAFYSLEAPVARVTAPDTPHPLRQSEDGHLPQTEQIVAAIRSVTR